VSLIYALSALIMIVSFLVTLVAMRVLMRAE
jgi:hypothetical protein